MQKQTKKCFQLSVLGYNVTRVKSLILSEIGLIGINGNLAIAKSVVIETPVNRILYWCEPLYNAIAFNENLFKMNLVLMGTPCSPRSVLIETPVSRNLYLEEPLQTGPAVMKISLN